MITVVMMMAMKSWKEWMRQFARIGLMQATTAKYPKAKYQRKKT